MKTIYEIQVSEILWDFFIKLIPFLIGFAIITLLFFKIRKQYRSNPESDFVKNINKQVSNPKIVFNIFQALVSVMFVVTTLFFVGVNNYNYDKYNEYKNGEYSVAEGYITDYSAPTGRVESFTVNEIYFSYLPNNSFGYAVAGSDGGAINKNGIYVKIYYIVDSNGDNCIMKLEVE